MRSLLNIILVIVAIGALGMLATVATADAPRPSVPDKPGTCEAASCTSFCWSEPGCLSYAECEPILIIQCTASYDFSTCA